MLQILNPNPESKGAAHGIAAFRPAGRCAPPALAPLKTCQMRRELQHTPYGDKFRLARGIY